MEAFAIVFWHWAESGILVVMAWIVKELWSIKKKQVQDTIKLRLDLEKLEHKVRFTKLYDQVSQNIIDLFPRLTKLKSDFMKLFADLEREGSPSKTDQYKVAADSFNDAFNFLHEKRLLMPVSIFTEVDAYLSGAKTIIKEFKSGMGKEKHGKLPDADIHYSQKAADDVKKMEPKYEKIHETMQHVLGF